ncbi:MAG: ATP synthase F0 subunit B [Verrucomicrobiota bacterium]
MRFSSQHHLLLLSLLTLSIMEVATDFASSFGLEWPKFIAQVLIFIIVFSILRAKVFGPIQGMLEQRRQRIEELESDRVKVKAELEKAEETAKEVVTAANADAERLIEEARSSADSLKERKTQEATAEATQIIEKAREATEMERKQAMAELKAEFGRLVVDTTSKVTGKVLNPEDQARINQETAENIGMN